ncbi:hypothetical protein [Sporosarcina sp. FSL K6-1508]|uniref:hypothetical protein n=1 Tax=Sporosarcina sp. FSL K6-1508 TaxID=2921553 RepID=UPI0030F4EFCA
MIEKHIYLFENGMGNCGSVVVIKGVQVMSLLVFFPFLIYWGIIIFGIYAVLTILKSAKQRNEYLKEIRDELKKKV